MGQAGGGSPRGRDGSIGAWLRGVGRTSESLSMEEPGGPHGVLSPSWGPKPIVGPCAIPLELFDCSFFSPHFFRSVLFWNRTFLSFPGTPAPPYGVLEDSFAFSKVILSFMVH